MNIIETMNNLKHYSEYSHTAAIRCYKRDDVNYVSINPVCKDPYRFAVQVSKRKPANDNHAR